MDYDYDYDAYCQKSCMLFRLNNVYFSLTCFVKNSPLLIKSAS